jgi:hypothetical protein
LDTCDKIGIRIDGKGDLPLFLFLESCFGIIPSFTIELLVERVDKSNLLEKGLIQKYSVLSTDIFSLPVFNIPPLNHPI